MDEDGRLVLPPEIATQYGLNPGAKVLFEPDERGLRLHRPVSQLSKLYLEPSGRCNLDCITCMRNVWNAPDEIMAEATFDRIMAGLAQFSPPPLVFFGGIGEPLMHPQFPEMIVLWVSLDGATPESYADIRLGASLPKVL